MPKKFFLRLLIFVLPCVISLSYIVYEGVQTGELVPINNVIQRQLNDEAIIYNPAWRFEDMLRYKYDFVLAQRPTILATGSSRMMRFSSYFFHEANDEFYNAAMPGNGIDSIQAFLEGLENQTALPDIVIWGLDIHSYAGGFHHENMNLSISFTDELNRLKLSYQDITQHLIAERTSLNVNQPEWVKFDVHSLNWLGLTARQGLRGFRNDGSIYLSTVERARQQRMDNSLETFERGRGIYIGSESVSEENFTILEETLALMQSNDVVVIGVIMPYHSTFNEALGTDEAYSYATPARQRLEDLFAMYNFPYYDFLDASTVAGNDEEFFDLGHPGELLTLRVYTEIIRDNHTLFNDYSDVNQLEQYIEDAFSPFFVAGYHPYE